jgi:N-hydroxyarylamine O-acetyltransferase
MPLYRFDLEPQFLPDYEIANWYLCSHPESFFRSGVIAALAGEGCRYTLINNDFGIHHVGGETERRKLADAGELQSVLEDKMRIALPDVPELGSRLRGLFEETQP